jgi:hypothetical protein
VNTYSITFLAGTGGSLTGEAAQTVVHGGSATPVEAVPNSGYVFVRWSDGVTANPRTLTNVLAARTLTAEFVAVGPADPVGAFTVGFTNPASPEKRRLWDVTGHYHTALGAYDLVLDLTHDEKGAVTGSGTIAGTMPSGTGISVPLVVKGKLTGKAGVVSAKLGISGKAPSASAKGSLVLTVSGAALSGSFTTTLSSATGGKDSVAGACSLPLPGGMDGSLVVTLALVRDAKGGLAGTGQLTLANGRDVALVAKGTGTAAGSTLQLVGDKAANAAFSAVKLQVALTTLSDHTGTINALSGKAFGQAVAWP